MEIKINYTKERIEEITNEKITQKEWDYIKEILEDTLVDHFYDIGKQVIKTYVGGHDDILTEFRNN